MEVGLGTIFRKGVQNSKIDYSKSDKFVQKLFFVRTVTAD
jgi:hypothetical protein